MSGSDQAVELPAGSSPFGPKRLNLWIAPGVSRLNMYTLLFGSFFGIAMMGFINASQPYLFTEVLNIPPAGAGAAGPGAHEGYRRTTGARLT